MSSNLLIAAAAKTEVISIAFFVTNILPLILIFMIFYLLLIRPQQKRANEHRDRINAVQKNDEVITGGGLMGKVTRVTDEYVEIELAPGMRVKAVKSTLSHVESRGKKPVND